MKERNFIIKNRQGFTQVSNKMLSDQNISYKAKGILCHLLSHDTDRFIITSKTLIKHGADGKKAIQTGIQELKKNGYLNITREAGNKGNWTYILNMFGNKFTDIPKSDMSESDKSVLGVSNKNNNIKKTNPIKTGALKNEVCEEKKESNHDVLNNIEKNENLIELAKDSHTHTINRDIIQKTSLNQPEAHTNHLDIPKVEEIFLDSLKIDFIDNSEIERKYELQIRDINTKYDNILGQVPKLTTTELIGNSEKLMQTLGIGFDDNPRRILNKIYNSLPNDHHIMEDAKDVEVVRDFIAKYKSANPETRSALSKRLYQALELMIKIYYIKKFGEEFRGKLYPEILDKNLVLYLNCNPTLKYCFGGFSNDIDGVYDEIKRLIDKKNKKILDEIQEEKQKELARLEAYRKAEEYNSIPESERIAWQNRLHNIMTGKNRSTETLEVVRCRTHEEEMELNRLREMTAEMFRSNIKPEPWIRERVAELSTMRGYYGD